MFDEREIYTTPFSTFTSTSCISSLLSDLVRLLVRTIFSESLLFLDAISCCIYLLDELISSTSLEIFTLPWPADVRHLSKAACSDFPFSRSAFMRSCNPEIWTVALSKLLLHSSPSRVSWLFVSCNLL